ncbi:MAG: ATP-dependent protease LonB, partial [Thermoplasmata archaeon]
MEKNGNGAREENGSNILPPVDEWIKSQDFETTEDIKVPEKLIDQVIGQDEAVKIVKKAAMQKRHVLLIGEPGTGKSMLARAMTEFLPSEELEDILIYPNPDDPNEPKVRVVPAGRGKEIVNAHKAEAMQKKLQRAQTMAVLLLLIVGMSLILSINWNTRPITFNPMIFMMGLILAVILWISMGYRAPKDEKMHVPKLLVSHEPGDKPPFVDATGAHAGALLGDVRHDPYQSGGLETPAHERVEAGAIHKAHKGVLFIDEINMLRMESQQSLLTALQEKKFPIVGQSERSSGALVKTEPVPCDFILVAAGNLDSVQGMHPALRSRIRGYGYEVYMNTTMPDNDENRKKLIRFVAQEVVKDRKIPHFTKHAVAEIIKEAQRRSGRRGHLTLRLRELGGLVRVAGDIARERGARYVEARDVHEAKHIARTLEEQVAAKYIERRKEYKLFMTEGAQVGVVNGLAVIGGEAGVSESSGVVLPIVAEVAPALSREEGRIIATGKLGEIAREAVENVSALLKKYTGKDISNYDVHIQFLGTYEGVEGDSASISIATAVISAIEDVPVDQSIGMTGSLSVRGQVLPVGGIMAKIDAAIAVGLKKVIIPDENMKDVLFDDIGDKIEIIPARTIVDVLKHALMGEGKDALIEKLSAIVAHVGKKRKILPHPAPPTPSPQPSPSPSTLP